MKADSLAQDLFNQALKDLYLQAGAPSSREVSLLTKGAVSHTTVAEALRGRTLPRWSAVEALVLALHGDPESIRPLWVEAREERNTKAHAKGSVRRMRAPLKVTLFASFAIIDNTSSYDRVKRSIVDLGNGVSSATGADVEVVETDDKGSVRQAFRHRIRKGLDRQTVLICFLSPGYLRNLHYREELRSLLIAASSGDTKRTVLPITLVDYRQLAADFAGDALWESIAAYQAVDWSDLKSSDLGSGAWMRLIDSAVRRVADMVLAPASSTSRAEEEQFDVSVVDDEVNAPLRLLQEGVGRIPPILLEFGRIMERMGEKTGELADESSPTREADLETLRLLSVSFLQVASDLQETFELLDDAITKIMRFERIFPGLMEASFWEIIRNMAAEYVQFDELLKLVRTFERLQESNGPLSEISTNIYLGSYPLVDFRAMTSAWLEELKELRESKNRVG
ncbi:toll/interleukin-1 receptor domain-containing protein [Micromonospora chokoriensis]